MTRARFFASLVVVTATMGATIYAMEHDWINTVCYTLVATYWLAIMPPGRQSLTGSKPGKAEPN